MFFSKPKLPKLYIRRVVGESMSPTIAPGQIIVAWPRAGLRVNDVVIARQAGREVVKRIHHIDTQTGGVMLHGDNAQASTDGRLHGYTKPDDVYAVVQWPRKVKKQTAG